MKAVIVGTAGHIDHGKSALVRALTGIDPDRLEEEKRRGITIDIGFANLDLAGPSGEALRIGFVDVPGHERFVRNMLAGIGGIDLVLLVIAADEGVKPQTREHFDICRLLAVQRGITVLTKADLVDDETLQVVRMEAAEFLKGSFLDPANSPIVAVSSKTGEGLDQLRSKLAGLAAEIPAKDSAAIFRLPIDRVFTMKGFGTVITGTLLAGTVRKDDELEVHPIGKRVRVRGVQVHGAAAEQAIAGQRTALNLAGVEVADLARGMMLTAPQLFRPTTHVGVTIDLLRSVSGAPVNPGAGAPFKPSFVLSGTRRARVHFHVFTAETIAEVTLLGAKQLRPGESGFAELKLDQPLLLLPGDRFIIRQFSPVVTIGGGRVLDAVKPPKRAIGVLASDLSSRAEPERLDLSSRAEVAAATGAEGSAVRPEQPPLRRNRRSVDSKARLEFLRTLSHAASKQPGAPSSSPSFGERVGAREQPGAPSSSPSVGERVGQEPLAPGAPSSSPSFGERVGAREQPGAPSSSPSVGERVGAREPSGTPSFPIVWERVDQELLARVARRSSQGLSIPEAVAETGWQPRQVERVANELAGAGELARFDDRLLASAWLESLARQMLTKVDEFHRANPLQPGINKDELRESLALEPQIFRGVLNSLVSGAPSSSPSPGEGLSTQVQPPDLSSRPERVRLLRNQTRVVEGPAVRPDNITLPGVPLEPGSPTSAASRSLGWMRDVRMSGTPSGKLQLDGDVVHAAGKGVVLRDEEAESKAQIERAFAQAGLKVPLLKEVLASLPVDKVRAQKLVTLLLRDRVLVKLSDELVFHRDALAALRAQIAAQKAKTPKLNVANFKDLFGITRKHAIPLLEYLDRERVTRRVGDERIIL